MKNPETKTKLRAVLKAAVYGVLIFAAFTVFAMCGCVIFRGDFFGGLYFWVSVPGDLLWHFFVGPMSANPFNSLFLYVSYCVIVNGLIGVLVCAVFAFLWQFRARDNRENKNQTTGI